MTDSSLVILNDGVLPNKGDQETEEIDKNIRIIITKLKGNYMNEDGSRVDYLKMAESELFIQYSEEVAKLKFLQPENLSENRRKCLFINIYNSLTIHAMVFQSCKGHIPESPIKVPGFWKIHAYNIGGLVYTLDQMEHGVLRANRGHPSAGGPEFPQSDPRLPVCLSLLDPRIHFALNCGARSCPPIRVYTEDRIETQLDLAATSFLSQEVIIEKKENGSFEVNVSKLLQWYGSDFGDSPTDVLTWIIKRLASDKFHLDEIVKSGFQIIFRDYDWASNLLGEKRAL